MFVWREIKEEYGQGTATTRKILKDLHKEAEEKRREHRETYKEKIDHLRTKCEDRKKKENEELP